MTNKLNKTYLQEVAIKKFSYKNLDFPESLALINHSTIEEAKAGWQTMLAHQIFNLVSF